MSLVGFISLKSISMVICCGCGATPPTPLLVRWGVGAGGVGYTLTTYAHKMVKVEQTLHKGGQYDRLNLPGVLYFTHFHNDGVFLRSTT